MLQCRNCVLERVAASEADLIRLNEKVLLDFFRTEQNLKATCIAAQSHTLTDDCYTFLLQRN